MTAIPETPETLGAGYFDGMYAAAADPWGFEERWYERRKYAISLAMLPRERYRAAFEPGCSDRRVHPDARPALRHPAGLRPGRGRGPGRGGADRGPAPGPGRAAGHPRAVAVRPLRPDRAVRGLVLLRRPRPGAGAEAAPPPRSSRTARCSPCTGGTRWPSTRGPATTCTGCSPPSPAWPAWPSTPRPISWPRCTSAPRGCPLRSPRRRAWCDRSRRVASAGVVVPAHNEEELLPACLAALREAAGSAGDPGPPAGRGRRLHRRDGRGGGRGAGPRSSGSGPATWARPGRPAWPGCCGGRRAPIRPRSGWPPPTPTPSCRPAGCAASSATPARAGTWCSGPSPSPTGPSTRRTRRRCSRRCTGSARDRTRTCTGRTSASGRRPTWRRAGSGRCGRRKTTPCMAAATEAGCQVLQAGDITVETSARRQARAPRGFSHALRALAAEPGPGGGPRRRQPAVC